MASEVNKIDSILLYNYIVHILPIVESAFLAASVSIFLNLSSLLKFLNLKANI